MLAKTHTAFALVTSTVGLVAIDFMGYKLDIISTLYFLASIYFGALFPDIDEPHSKIGRIFIGVSNLMNHLFGHRGLTHTILFIAILGVICQSIFLFLTKTSLIHYSSYIQIAIFGFLLGNLLHIAGDMMTISGVPIFYPFIRKNYHLLPFRLRFRTGGAMDNTIMVVCLIMFIFLIATYLGEHNLKDFENIAKGKIHFDEVNFNFNYIDVSRILEILKTIL